MNQQINSLTSTRGVAALLVFIFHYGTGIFPFNKLHWLFGNGNLSVSYFFVLSGFIMYVTYRHQDVPYEHFIRKRIARIYPVYLFALLLQIFVIRRDLANDPNAVGEILSSLLVMHAYFPSYALSLNSPGWSICSELLFYLGFPFLLYFVRRRTTFFIIITVLFYVLTQLLCLELCRFPKGINVPWAFFRYNPIIHINQFLIGVLGGLAFNPNANRKQNAVIPVMVLIFISGILYFKPNWVDATAGLLAPLFILFIVTTAPTDLRLLNIKPLVYLGEISYSLYILQSPVRELIHQFNAQFNLLSDGTLFYISLVILILAAAFSNHFIEKPFRQWLMFKNNAGIYGPV